MCIHEFFYMQIWTENTNYIYSLRIELRHYYENLEDRKEKNVNLDGIFYKQGLTWLFYIYTNRNPWVKKIDDNIGRSLIYGIHSL